jgi:hypothetical protein
MFNDLMWDVIVDICRIVYHHCLHFFIRVMHHYFIRVTQGIYNNIINPSPDLGQTHICGERTDTHILQILTMTSHINIIEHRTEPNFIMSYDSFLCSMILMWDVIVDICRICVSVRSPHMCVCPKSGLGFIMSYGLVLFYVQWYWCEMSSLIFVESTNINNDISHQIIEHRKEPDHMTL